MPRKLRKIAIMGFRSVGKSSLTIQFVENHFVDSYDPTIENTFNKIMRVRGQEYEVQLIDTAGQDEYSIVPQSYSMNIDGYVIVYSVTSAQSLRVAKTIHDKLLDMTGKPTIPMVLVGNKTDLRMESGMVKTAGDEDGYDRVRAVSAEVGRRQANEWKAAFLEASAKENQKVSEIFSTIILEIERAEGNIKEESSCVMS